MVVDRSDMTRRCRAAAPERVFQNDFLPANISMLPVSVQMKSRR